MRKKIILIAVILIIALGIIALCAAAWHFSTQLIAPKPYTCEKEHFIYCGGAAELGIPYREVEFTNDDHGLLKGWLFPAPSRKAVVMVHGITADRREGLRWVPALHRAGFNLLLFDLRNHGTSYRSKTGMGYREKNDIIAAVTFLERQGMKQIGVFGVSMGASSAIQAMAADTRIKAGMFEAGFAHLGDLLAEIAKRDFGLPRFPIINAVMAVYSIRLGDDANLINPEDYIGSIAPRPVYILHCDGDDYISSSHAKRLYGKAGEPKSLWLAKCNMHARAWQSNPAEAEKRAVEFFSAHLK